jgi:hypothetical protein
MDLVAGKCQSVPSVSELLEKDSFIGSASERSSSSAPVAVGTTRSNWLDELLEDDCIVG